MKFVICILSATNIYPGIINFLDAVHVLQDSKYSQTATTVFAILFLGMGLAGLYFLMVKHNSKLPLLVEIGPWILALLFLDLNLRRWQQI